MFVIILKKEGEMRFLFLCIAVYVFAFEITPLHSVKYDKNKAKLGEKLFFDKRLSKHGDICCASCHKLSSYGVDNKRFSVGSGGTVDKPMNSLSVYNVVFNVGYFWNGRAESLKQQVIESLEDKKEHNLSAAEVEKIVNGDKRYVKEFEKIYRNKPTLNEVADAIAEYEKSLVTLNSKFDRYLKGEGNLTKKELRGYRKFKTYGCITCHNGINVGGNSYQKLGVFIKDKKIMRGEDRSEITKLKDDEYVYKVPSLRNVEKTYPYFHDGSVKSLKKAIKLMGELNLGIEIPDKDLDDMEAFLKTLTGKVKK
jgi:cytochrome c peroxidase